MFEIVSARRKSIALGDEGKDVLSVLIKAKDASGEKSEGIDESALVGNFFIFLVGQFTLCFGLLRRLRLIIIFIDSRSRNE